MAILLLIPPINAIYESSFIFEIIYLTYNKFQVGELHKLSLKAYFPSFSAAQPILTPEFYCMCRSSKYTQINDIVKIK